MTRAIKILAIMALLSLPSAALSQPNAQITPSETDLRYALNKAIVIIGGMHELPAPEISHLAFESNLILAQESEGPLKDLNSILLKRASEAATDLEYENDLNTATEFFRPLLMFAPEKAEELFQSWKPPAIPGMLKRDETYQQFKNRFASIRLESSFVTEDPLKALEALKVKPDPNLSFSFFSNLFMNLAIQGKKDIAATLFEQEVMPMVNDPVRSQLLPLVVHSCLGKLPIPPRVLDGYAKVIKTTFSDMTVGELRLNRYAFPVSVQEQRVLEVLLPMAVQGQPSGQYLLDLFPNLKEKLVPAGGLPALRDAPEIDFRDSAGNISWRRSNRQIEKDIIQKLGSTANRDPEAANQALMNKFGKRDDFDRILYIASESKDEFPALSSAAWSTAKALILKQESQDERISMTQELLAKYVEANGTLDKRMVEFALSVVQPRVPANSINPDDRLNPQTPSGLEIYIIGEWAALDFEDAAAYAERIPQDLLRLSAWIEIAEAYHRRVMNLRSDR